MWNQASDDRQVLDALTRRLGLRHVKIRHNHMSCCTGLTLHIPVPTAAGPSMDELSLLKESVRNLFPSIPTVSNLEFGDFGWELARRE